MIVLGYHGCSRDLALDVVNRREVLLAKKLPYHWLGDGVYFWENDPHRALEWAQEKQSRAELTDPCVIGAVIELGECLDLHVRENQNLIQIGYKELAEVHARTGKKMPVNKPARGDMREDAVLRFLDCAVINYVATLSSENGNPFDTVRGLFVEGEALYPGAKLFHKTHSEIAVRNPARIIGYFLPDQQMIAATLQPKL